VGASLRVPNPFAWLWDSLLILRNVGRLTAVIRDLSTDVVVTKGFPAHFVGGLAARRLGIPCVWHVQDLISERTFGIYRRIFAFAACRVPRRIVADGAAIKMQLPSLVQSRTSVIHNGVDTATFRPGLDGSRVRRELGISKKQIVIGHAGRITPWKGQHYVIEAFARIAAAYPDACLVIVGAPVFDTDAYYRRLRAMAADSGLQDRIKFAGYRHDLRDVLAALDIFTFTSVEKDTSPLALLSAMSSGLPIVAFDIAGVRELMASDDQFLLAPVGDVDRFGEALSAVLTNQDLRARLSRESRQQASSEFSLDKNTARIEQVLCDSLDTISVSCGTGVMAAGPVASELRDCAQ